MDGEAQQVTVHGVAKSQTQLSDFTLPYLDFFHQCFIVFYIGVFSFFRQICSQVFYSFCCNGEWNCFLNFSFYFLTISVQECKGFLCVDFISCNFTIFIDEKVDEEIKETIPFTIATKRIKYLGIYLPKETKDLYIENYKTLMK